MVHEGVTLKHSSLRLILSYATITGHLIWAQHVDQAYFHSDEPLKRPTYLRPPDLYSCLEHFCGNCLRRCMEFVTHVTICLIPFENIS